MSDDPTLCSHCGAKMVEYKHSLSKSIVVALDKIVKAAGPDRIFDIAHSDLTYSERCNALKLQYWNIIVPHGDNAKGGRWTVTDTGVQFLNGEAKLPKSVWTYRGSPVRFTGDEVSAESVRDGWKHRPDYAREANPVGS